MRKIMFGAALGALGFATAANASLVSLTFVPFGGGIAPPIVPEGETAVTMTSGDTSCAADAMTVNVPSDLFGWMKNVLLVVRLTLRV